MAGLSTLRLRWMRSTGTMPSAAKIEARRRAALRLYERYTNFRDSAEHARYKELRELVDSGDVARVQEECRIATFAGSKEEGQLRDFKQLKKNPEVRRAIKGKGDRNSPDYSRYLKLKETVNSQEFVARVAHLKDSKKFEKTDAGRALRELKSLEKSRELKWYTSQKSKGTFAEFENREECFFDDFSEISLDTRRWTPRFHWGQALLGKSYSFIGDPHCYTDGENLSVENSCLVIETRPQQAESLAWDSKLGFMPKKFNYTSGVVTSGQSFRMNHGLFEAKVRFTAEPGVYHAFYLVGDSRVPQVDVFRSNVGNARLISGLYTHKEKGQPHSENVGNLPFSKEFFILSVEWSKKRIEWRINGVPYMEQTTNLPDQPLYLVFASGIVPGSEPGGVSRLEIDWVRCLSAPGE